MRLVLPFLALSVVLLAAYVPAPPPAPAERWDNLQVLPDTLSRDALMGIMRGFTGALGVRCDHCHARGEEGPPDFPSDANPMKDVARDMLRMTWQINTETLPAIEGLGDADGMRVTCYTCHRGAARPATQAAPDGEEVPADPDPRESPHDDHR